MYGPSLWSREKGRSDWPLGGALGEKKNAKMAIAAQQPFQTSMQCLCPRCHDGL